MTPRRLAGLFLVLALAVVAVGTTLFSGGPAPPAHAQTTGEITLWTGTLVAGSGSFDGTAATGYCTGTDCFPDDFGSLDLPTFTHATVPYTVQRILVTASLGFLKLSSRLDLNVTTPLDLYVGDTKYPLTYSQSTGELHLTGIPALTSGQSYQVSIRTTPPPPPPPETIETATLVAGSGTLEGGAATGYCDGGLCNPTLFGSLTATTFTHAGSQYEVLQILSGELVIITGEPRLSDITLYLNDAQYPLTYNSGTQQYHVTGSIALTSGQSYTVSIRTPPPEGTLWMATLTAGSGPLEGVAATGYCTGGRCNTGHFGSLNPAAFTHKGVQYTVSKLLVKGSGGGVMTLSPCLDQVTPFSLYVGDTAYPATFGAGGEEYNLTGTPVLTAGQTYTVSIRIPPPAPPDTTPETTLWATTMTVGVGSGYIGYSGVGGSVASDEFVFNGSTYRVIVLTYGGPPPTPNRLQLVFLKGGGRSSLGAGMFRLTLGSRSFEFDGSTGYSSALRGYYFTDHGLNWSNGQSVAVSLVDFTPARPGTLWRGSLTAAAGVYNSANGVGYCGDLPVCDPSSFGSLAKPTQFTYEEATRTVRALMSGGGGGLTRVCKIEIIATNRPHRPWIPAYAGMTEWAR